MPYFDQHAYQALFPSSITSALDAASRNARAKPQRFRTNPAQFLTFQPQDCYNQEIKFQRTLTMVQLMKNDFTRRIRRSTVMLALLGLVSGLTSVLELATTAMATPFPGASVEPVVWLDAGVGVMTGDTVNERCQRDARGTVRFDRRRR